MELHAYLNPETGLIELIDPKSGAVVKVQKTKESLVEDSFVEAEVDGHKLLVERGIDLDRFANRVSRWLYSNVMGQVIAQTMVEKNLSLKKVCEENGMPPYSVVCRWRRQHQEFRQMLEDARRDRAELLAEEALELADDADEDADAISKARLRVDVRKWAAEKADPDKFGAKKAVDGNGSVSVTLVLNTGIVREGDPGFKEVTPYGENKAALQGSGSPDLGHRSSPELERPVEPGGGGAGESSGIAAPEDSLRER